MSVLALFLTLFSVGSLASPIAKRQVPSFVFNGDAPFTVDSETLAAALTCPNGVPTQVAPPVLLVHGTGTTGQETWGEGYVPALSANGYTACYVTLPGRAMGDMQVSSEYVAYGLHYISYLSGGLQTAVISHSQGGPDTQWALQFWPSSRTVTNSFIPLSPDFSGIDLLGSDLSDVCVGDLCQASLWQQSAGSHYYTALHAHSFAAQVPTTAIWSSSDGVVNPPKKNAQLPSAGAIAVQDLCPLRIVSHISMPTDAAAFALALDALKHGGSGILWRVLPSAWKVCFEINAPNMNVEVADQLQADLNDLVNGFVLGSPRVTQEPPVMAYAQ
ncbi:hypothetical protein LTR91_002494 [Friedmanniomyces endolithicus]|uniref:AB hydrolase-1 domain-containing protein n=1 Tax=Friedmanniomyces endolithicus TaxID=329885 RepID=A0AAN6L1Z2_9PEZI|nr:hypothetical protein LTR01_003054 [Friedmanniomyces endolithicus]KAK0321756.1 hypothetical protein LTR82_007242 [Friedmanniomyces endolithicus]KAK0920815.1 hypothetical protein LTR57_009300 [Friedmanniomyces endolithicus]KAK0998362.1 hypothetical protein LTR54_009500 [Friedmanniomyces endolithicus]KAK1008574.1 hypothetical protein LTS01_002332 [Friedmanniomyces endolithicus]